MTDSQMPQKSPILLLAFLKLVHTEMELSLSVIKELAVLVGALDFLISFNRMLEDKVSNTSLGLSEFLEMNKLIKVEIFLVKLVNYKANLMFPAKGRILQFLINDLLLTWRADLIACMKYRIQVVLREMNF
ncbi:hypothetical protein ACH5RR_026587 [Cinchona calisaya]|uniref:Uncharacterized protein n=1 Tax=Cinchona calisaya TaxID=153742 RepID=A0ABD2Z6E2_9GENT